MDMKELKVAVAEILREVAKAGIRSAESILGNLDVSDAYMEELIATVEALPESTDIALVISVWRGVFDEAKAFRDLKKAQEFAETLHKESEDQDFDVDVITTTIVE